MDKAISTNIEYFTNTANREKKILELLLMRENASPLSSESKKDLRRIAVVLTTFCNLTCVWCHREEESVKNSNYLHKHMDFEKLKIILPKLKGFDILHWGGLGEPLLYKKFNEATELARRYVPFVKTTSNGTSLTRKKVDQLVNSGINQLEVSIDGFDGETNKLYRGAHEDGIINNLEDISSRHDIPLQINSVLSDKNYNSLFSLVEKLKNVTNIKKIHTIPLFMTEHMKKLNINSISSDMHKKLLISLKKDIDKYNLDWVLTPDIEILDTDPVYSLKRKNNICFTPYEDPMINVDGNLVPCGRLQHYNLGSVVDSTFEDTWNGKKMLSFRTGHIKELFNKDCVRECGMRCKNINI